MSQAIARPLIGWRICLDTLSLMFMPLLLRRPGTALLFSSLSWSRTASLHPHGRALTPSASLHIRLSRPFLGLILLLLLRLTWVRLPSLVGMPCLMPSLSYLLPQPWWTPSEGRVMLSGPDLPATGTLQQSTTACTPQELNRAFEDFWRPIWQRDAPGPSASPGYWEEADTLLQSLPAYTAPLTLDVVSESVWTAAIKRMGGRRATGACGWAPTDLKLLPKAAVRVLSRLFTRAVDLGLPANLLLARVCVLAKTPAPSHAGQSRPIVVFSCLYRLWSSIVARQVLSGWGEHFPAELVGSMPGRSCRDLSLRQQHQIELSLLEGTPRLGCSVDIVKCFNQLGWHPVKRMLLRLGVPDSICSFWVDCLAKTKKCPSFRGSVFSGLLSCNGAPEGDPLSVVAMAAACWHCHAALQDLEVQFDTYVDNWSWSGSSPAALQLAIPRSLQFLGRLKLPVDWSKSYCWGTTREARRFWRQFGPTLVPPGAELRIVTEATDLGVAYRFDGHAQCQAS